MIELASPELLFEKQKIYNCRQSVTDTNSTRTPKKVVVVFSYGEVNLPAQLKEMLDRMMAACQFKDNDYVYLNAGITDVSLGKVQNEFDPAAVLFFGEAVVSHNINKLQKNFVYEICGMKVLSTDSLETLAKNDAVKKTLWVVLKKMLGI